MSQFLRKAQVIIGKPGEGDSLTVNTPTSTPDSRISFSVSKTGTAKANKASIEIYNLSFLSRDIIDDLGQTVTLNVGYRQKRRDFNEFINDNILRTIYFGDFLEVVHEYRSPEWITKIVAGDGINILREKKVSVGSGKGANVFDVFKDMVKQAGLVVQGQLEDIFTPEQKNKKLSKGFTFNGLVKDGLNKIADIFDLNWSIENGDLKILQKNAINETEVLYLDKTTGLIESPQRLREQKNKANKENYRPGYLIKSLLQPTIEPGKLIHVKSAVDELDTEFIVAEVEHVGDT